MDIRSDAEGDLLVAAGVFGVGPGPGPGGSVVDSSCFDNDCCDGGCAFASPLPVEREVGGGSKIPIREAAPLGDDFSLDGGPVVMASSQKIK